MALLDIGGAAEYLNVNQRFVRRLVAERRIDYLKIGKFIRFDERDLENWIEQRRVDASEGRCTDCAALVIEVRQ